MFKAIPPANSKSEVNRAGNRIRAANGDPNPRDIEIVENWRASHLWVLNTFQASLRRRAKGKPITVAQRLKRRNTIFDKLRREPEMQLARMQDIAGCRVIFKDQDALFAFRKSLHESRMKHVLRNGDDDRYNYILRPKQSGYRGVHDVYQYKVTSQQGEQWNGLLVEIQYRTVYQHAWATAVEIADFEGGSRIKFSEADENHRHFFQLASEMLARQFEGQHSCLPTLPNDFLVEAFKDLDNRIGLMDYFRRLRKTGEGSHFTENTILIFWPASTGADEQLEVKTFTSMSSAVEMYNHLERELGPSADIVLVRAADPENIRDSFRNYFSDVVEFVRFIEEASYELPNRLNRS